MRILVAEDDLASRRFISKFLSAYGECDVTTDGIEVIEAFVSALDAGNPYDLICLDVMMPKVDGIKALRTIRELEEIRGVEEDKKAKVIITTALGETQYIMSAFEISGEASRIAYVGKPIEVNIMEDAMKKLGLIKD